jgi:hypothetical protein
VLMQRFFQILLDVNERKEVGLPHFDHHIHAAKTLAIV